jgi:haloalkane dehalogenase
VDTYRTPDERFQGLPEYDFEPRYLDQDGMRMHYIESGAGDPVLMLHGEPTWSFLYRKMIPLVAAAGHRVIAPDLFGFGRSDKPTDMAWYTYDRHVDSVKRLVTELDLRDATIVVHDWGGPIGLRVATEMDDRFARMVILNTGIFSGHNRMTEAWWAFRNFVDRNKPDFPIAMLVAGACAVPPGDDVLAAYEAPFPVPESKWGASAFPLLIPTKPDEPGAAEMTATNERLKQWDKPTLVAFSDSDPVLPSRIGERFVERIPGARKPMTLIEGAAHFLQEDKGEVVAQHIVDFLAT